MGTTLKLDLDRLRTVANSLVQIAVAVLPIGAGVCGIILQTKFTAMLGFTVFIVWVAMVILGVSIFVNLNALRSSESASGNLQRIANNLSRGLYLFVIGIILLTVSPLGLIANAMSPSPQLEMVFAQSEIMALLPPVVAGPASNPAEVPFEIFVRYSGPNEQPLDLVPDTGSADCIRGTLTTPKVQLRDGDTQVVHGSLSVAPACKEGYYWFSVKALYAAHVAGAGKMNVRISR